MGRKEIKKDMSGRGVLNAKGRENREDQKKMWGGVRYEGTATGGAGG